MRSIVAVLLVVLLAASAHLAHAQNCTGEDCIMVFQYFTTADCSGNSTFEEASNLSTPCRTIEAFTNITTFKTCSNEVGNVALQTIGSTSCARQKSTYVDRYPVGVCYQTDASASYILWCNRNAVSNNFKPKKAVIDAAVIYDASPCNSRTGCSGNTGTYNTYSEAGCPAASLTSSSEASMLAGGHLVIGTCYAQNASSDTAEDYSVRNIHTSCSNGLFTVTRSLGGCGSDSNVYRAQSYPTGTCFLNGPNVWVLITCPTSAASALVAGVVGHLGVILLIAFLII